MAFSIALIAVAVAVVGAAVSAYGVYESQQNRKDLLKEQAKIREEDAAMTQLVGEAAAERQRKRDEHAIESFKARAGAAGVTAGEGSSLLAELDFATDAEVEAQHVQYGYKLEARGKQMQAGYARLQAGQIHPEMAAGISLLSSAGTIATNYGGGLGKQSDAGGGLTKKTGYVPMDE